MNNLETMQMLNTSIVNSKSEGIDNDYDSRLTALCESEEMKAISSVVEKLSNALSITRDEAANRIFGTIRELDKVWDDYLLMEGLLALKNKEGGYQCH